MNMRMRQRFVTHLSSLPVKIAYTKIAPFNLNMIYVHICHPKSLAMGLRERERDGGREGEREREGGRERSLTISYWKVKAQHIVPYLSPPSQLDEATVSLLSCVVTLCQSALSKDALHAPSELVVTLRILHGMMLRCDLSVQL